MTTPRTRPATEADVFVMEQIMLDAFGASYAYFMPEPYVRQFYDDGSAAKVIQERLRAAGVAEIKHKIIGFAIRQQDYLAEFWVAPESQKQGAGRALMRWAEETARAAGHKKLWLCCYKANKTALDFYWKHGFEIVEEFPSTEVAGGPVPVCKLQKALYAED